MLRDAAAILYLAGLVFAEALRLPRRVGRIRSSQVWSRGKATGQCLEVLVLAAVILGVWALPLIYVFTDWLQPLNYSVPAWAVWFAAGVFGVAGVIRWNAQRALGEQWSFTLGTAEKHKLVTSGIYARIRHPIYASLVLWAMAQPLLLQNVIAGWSGSVAVALIWLVRVPREEKLMREKFGGEYEEYEARTRRLIPRFRVKHQAM